MYWSLPLFVWLALFCLGQSLGRVVRVRWRMRYPTRPCIVGAVGVVCVRVVDRLRHQGLVQQSGWWWPVVRFGLFAPRRRRKQGRQRRSWCGPVFDLQWVRGCWPCMQGQPVTSGVGQWSTQYVAEVVAAGVTDERCFASPPLELVPSRLMGPPLEVAGCSVLAAFPWVLLSLG
jgi:hypothetical protein